MQINKNVNQGGGKMKLKQIDFDSIKKPFSKQEVLSVLSSNIYRSDFINNYTFFETDGHIKLYIDFIEATNIKHSSNRIDDAVMLADSLSYYSKSFFVVIEGILSSRRNAFLKLTCLDYVLSQNKRISKNAYLMLNEKYSISKNDFLKIQSNINLLLTKRNITSQKSIIEVLKRAPYPNIFYRFFNSINYNFLSFNNQISKKFIQDIQKIGMQGDFSKENKNEIKKISSALLKRIGGSCSDLHLSYQDII